METLTEEKKVPPFDEDGNEVIYRWTPPPREKGTDDCYDQTPDEYVVTRWGPGRAQIMLNGCYHGKWQANISERGLVEHLIQESAAAAIYRQHLEMQRDTEFADVWSARTIAGYALQENRGGELFLARFRHQVERAAKAEQQVAALLAERDAARWRDVRGATRPPEDPAMQGYSVPAILWATYTDQEQVIGRWAFDYEGWVAADLRDGPRPDSYFEDVRVTHWRPLPAAPPLPSTPAVAGDENES